MRKESITLGNIGDAPSFRGLVREVTAIETKNVSFRVLQASDKPKGHGFP
jgi:hypothetical protein